MMYMNVIALVAIACNGQPGRLSKGPEMVQTICTENVFKSVFSQKSHKRIVRKIVTNHVCMRNVHKPLARNTYTNHVSAELVWTDKKVSNPNVMNTNNKHVSGK